MVQGPLQLSQAEVRRERIEWRQGVGGREGCERVTARILDGRAVGREVLAEVAERVRALRARGVAPRLAVVLVGDDPASAVYVRNKGRRAAEVGIDTVDLRLPAETTEADLLGRIGELAGDPSVHGILVQLPLPAHVDPQRVLRAIPPEKDVDGFHPQNMGQLVLGPPALVPCTPAGCMILLDRTGIDLAGKRAVVVGRSNIVGKPMAHLLLAADATVTIAHSRTRDLPSLVREADVVVAAVGRPGLVKGAWIREGAVVVDVGINRVDGKLVGDVEFAAAAERAAWITPVPGGVGPMTIACLMRNVAAAAEAAV
ncbi:MAG: bifunctional methylenetetrahydrofolate dehydrogenase/methenyltetrahydrofolate cyclohydrolase FolD [Deltaproteobacteria bacterium]|nr:MAG: bifunctional methylenetetrahydrofolate dehydrogenase/methenyltetrahydrofolate cyclohydrolase FolD [Deltaproteobacteria bacterium]